MRFLYYIWALLIATLLISTFFSGEAASFVYFLRYIYIVVLVICITGAALGLLHTHHSEGNNGKIKGRSPKN